MRTHLAGTLEYTAKEETYVQRTRIIKCRGKRAMIITQIKKHCRTATCRNKRTPPPCKWNLEKKG